MRLSKLHKAIISIQLAVLLILPVSADDIGISGLYDYKYCYAFEGSEIILLTATPLYLGIVQESSYYDPIIGCDTPIIAIIPTDTISAGKQEYKICQMPINSKGYRIALQYEASSSDLREVNWYYNKTSNKIYEGFSFDYQLDPQSYAQIVYVTGSGGTWYGYYIRNIITSYKQIYVAGNPDNYYYSVNSYPLLDVKVSQKDTLASWYNNFITQTSIDSIITAIENQTSIIINYGSDYPLPSGGAELESAQSALSEAEGAISDKASSIKEQISSHVQSNLELAASSADKVKQDSVQIKQLYATVTSSLPDEVKLLFVVVPLLLFVGWLIGRVRQ